MNNYFKIKKRNKKIKAFKLILIITAFCTAIIISTGSILAANFKDSKDGRIKYYASMTLKHEDTLWDISKLYKSPDESHAEYIKNIKSLNQLNDESIHSGQHLIYYYYK